MMRRRILSLLSTSPTPQAFVGDWHRLNEEIRWQGTTGDDSVSLANSVVTHHCTAQCYRDARHIIRCILTGRGFVDNSARRISLGAEPLDYDRRNCLRLRVLRMCRQELGIGLLGDIDFTRDDDSGGAGGSEQWFVTLHTINEDD
jgi:hypothetical protein